MWAVFFMRRPVQWNYAAKAAHGPRGEQGKNSPARFHRPVQWNYAAKAAHGPRSEQGKTPLPDCTGSYRGNCC